MRFSTHREWFYRNWWVIRGKTDERVFERTIFLSSTTSRCLTVLLSIDLFCISSWEKVPRESLFHEWIIFKRADNLMIGFARNSRNILYSSFTDGLSTTHGARRMLNTRSFVREFAKIYSCVHVRCNGSDSSLLTTISRDSSIMSTA